MSTQSAALTFPVPLSQVQVAVNHDGSAILSRYKADVHARQCAIGRCLRSAVHSLLTRLTHQISKSCYGYIGQACRRAWYLRLTGAGYQPSAASLCHVRIERRQRCGHHLAHKPGFCTSDISSFSLPVRDAFALQYFHGKADACRVLIIRSSYSHCVQFALQPF